MSAPIRASTWRRAAAQSRLLLTVLAEAKDVAERDRLVAYYARDLVGMFAVGCAPDDVLRCAAAELEGGTPRGEAVARVTLSAATNGASDAFDVHSPWYWQAMEESDDVLLRRTLTLRDAEMFACDEPSYEDVPALFTKRLDAYCNYIRGHFRGAEPLPSQVLRDVLMEVRRTRDMLLVADLSRVCDAFGDGARSPSEARERFLRALELTGSARPAWAGGPERVQWHARPPEPASALPEEHVFTEEDKALLLDLEASLVTGLPHGLVPERWAKIVAHIANVANRSLPLDARENSRLQLLRVAPFLGVTRGTLVSGPVAAEVRAELEAAWRNAADAWPEDADVQANAAEFLRTCDVRAARAASHRLLALDPSWRSHWLASSIELASTDHGLAHASFERAAELADQAVELVPGPVPVCADAALASFLAGRFDRARALVLMTFDETMYSVSATRHTTLTVCGLLSLRAGDVEDAVSNLARAADEKPGSRGPSFRLADALVLAGRAAPVIDYVKKVAPTWPDDDGRTKGWLAALEHGERPRLLNPGC